ncbi:putative Hsp70 nucleotide exchange factor [Rhizodiscina lignyota]|uniref:Hsp70 nucleotide exchange factor n=1 Tax=Rhizodiscina lignyota TaxID=1504668 RepID=A0A9P4M7K7_9PEZI|nr:putative Hsp70 nucleotide exchange factor [Rhizodiscina lignyota]
MDDQGHLNNLLKWGIENSAASRDDSSARVNTDPPRTAGSGLSPEALAALLGGPSDADRMRDAMVAILSPEVDLENKLTAWDNFEQLIENIDNANNMEQLGMWTPLVKELDNTEAECRRMACWCIGTAVQNNIKAQERLQAHDAIPKLVELSIEDETQAVRKKAILALSSGIRNCQPNLDAAVKALPENEKPKSSIDAADMGAIDTIIQKLRDDSQQRG